MVQKESYTLENIINSSSFSRLAINISHVVNARAI